MRLYLSRYTVVDAINKWLNDNDQKVLIDGGVYNGKDLVARDIQWANGDVSVEVRDKRYEIPLGMSVPPDQWKP